MIPETSFSESARNANVIIRWSSDGANNAKAGAMLDAFRSMCDGQWQPRRKCVSQLVAK